MTHAHPFRYDDAAYALGALDAAESRVFEAHLDTCAQCRDRVVEMRAIVDLLGGATVADVASMPDTLLPGLLRAADRERGRRRWLTSSLAVAAAACGTTLVVLLWPSGTAQQVPAMAMHKLRPGPVSATVELVSRGWGTEIDLACHYGDNVEHYTAYRLVVQDETGRSQDLGTWTLAPGDETTFTAGTALLRSDIARVLVTRDDEKPILQLTL